MYPVARSWGVLIIPSRPSSAGRGRRLWRGERFRIWVSGSGRSTVTPRNRRFRNSRFFQSSGLPSRPDTNHHHPAQSVPPRPVHSVHPLLQKPSACSHVCDAGPLASPPVPVYPPYIIPSSSDSPPVHSLVTITISNVFYDVQLYPPRSMRRLDRSPPARQLHPPTFSSEIDDLGRHPISWEGEAAEDRRMRCHLRGKVNRPHRRRFPRHGA